VQPFLERTTASGVALYPYTVCAFGLARLGNRASSFRRFNRPYLHVIERMGSQVLRDDCLSSLHRQRHFER
jgi:hypothetical protein